MSKKIVHSTLVFLLLAATASAVLGHSDFPTLLEDVNKDGVVNIQDLVLVAASFGQLRDRSAQHDFDVNRDGVVNVLDLIRVSKSFGETVPNENSSYHDIQEYIFDKSCVNSACHAGPANAGNLNLTYGASYENLIGEIPQNPAAATAGMKLVDPSSPDNSFLLTKLMGATGPEQGAKMPFGSGILHNGKVEAVREWIKVGAPQTGKIEGVGDLGVLRDPEGTFEPPSPPPTGQGYQIHLPPYKIEPGTEREVFYATYITDENGEPIEDDIFINGYEIFYPTGSHHFILYKLTKQALTDGVIFAGANPDIAVDPTGTGPIHVFRELNPADPQALGNIGVHRLFVAGTQTDNYSFQFPEGVALRLPGATVFDLNSHYINLLGTQTLIGEVYVNLYTIPPEEVKYEAVEIFVSNPEIYVPPGLTRVTKMDWFIKNELERRGQSPNAVLNVMMLTSHMHRHRELFEISQMSTDKLLHRSVSYDNAPITFYDPPLVLDASDGLSFQCTHSNYSRESTLEFGFTSEDEMCLFVGYYYVSTQQSTKRN